MIMSEALYMTDCYLKNFEAEVTSVKDEKFIVLDKTAFYPNSGGQPHDTGKMEINDKQYNVVYTGKFDGKISHEVDKKGLKEGDTVSCSIDWQRRYLFMRYHSACHIISGVVSKNTGSEITGNQISEEKARIDFSLEDFNKEQFESFIEESNKLISKNMEIKIKILPRDEAFQIPSLVKLRKNLPESIQNIRVIEIENFDSQACAGTHVSNTKEIGKLEAIEIKNKGKDNKRIYFKINSL